MTDEQKILSNVRTRFETAHSAYAWYCSEPVPGFGGRTALQLVHQGEGQFVLEYINAIDAGVHA